MEIITKQLTLDTHSYYVKHISIVNVFLPKKLTPKEIEVLASFMSLEGDIARDRFGTSARKMVKEELKLSSGGLGNYLRDLKLSGFISNVNGKLSILPILYPENKMQGYMFKLYKDR